MKSELVFENSLLGIGQYTIRILYLVWLLLFMIFPPLVIWVAVSTQCPLPIKAVDFDPYKLFGYTQLDPAGVYYDCREEHLPATLLTIIGAFITFGMSSIVAYLYISRMRHTTRLLKRNTELDDTTLTSTTRDRATALRTNTNGKGNPIALHMRKSVLIAVTSIFSTMLALVVAGFVEQMRLLVYVDTVLNGILMCCAFTFGEGLYDFLFGCCCCWKL
ncbi:hypothetical protein RFI_14283 [Reticulomyxa filosa]|uniref:Uncharacterized protein n=1 Tax=Reticulomyxa filosa TaxID=46433 RepID=X6NAY6_RETFI|nr:hypothetical protein RFI_14283 [Reticulomyxa filosa]|eukprot:ETO22909.1 hypothetical protein RFI_14283 [Reticulomyxa filosa]